MSRACGNDRCGVSTGYFGDELTFGRGKLDDYGYWSIPCEPCARQHEREHPSSGECWPFAERYARPVGGEWSPAQHARRAA